MTSNRKLILVGLAALGALLLMLGIQRAGTASENQKTAQQTQAKTAAITGSLTGTGTVQQQLAAGAEKEKEAVPAQTDAGTVLRTVSAAEASSGLKVKDVQFEAEGSGGDVFTVTATGSYAATTRFIAALQDTVSVEGNKLIINGRLVIINGVTITRADDTGGSTLSVIIRATAPYGAGAASTPPAAGTPPNQAAVPTP